MMHLLMQTPSVHHNLEFVVATTVANSTEVRGTSTGGLRCVRSLLDGYAARNNTDTWVARRDMPSGLEPMPYSEFASCFRVNRGGLITRLTGSNRAVSFRPFVSCSPRGGRYHEYCRNSLVKYRSWSGGLWEGWGGEEGELATTEDPVARQRMIDNWVSFRDTTLQLDPAERPRGFTARDLDFTHNRRQRRRRREGEDSEREENEEDDGSSYGFSDDEEENLDGIHGDGGPLREDGVVTRRWADGRDGQSVDWSNGQWAQNASVREDTTTWVSMNRDSAAADTRRAAAEGITGVQTRVLPAEGGEHVLNEKQQLAVTLVYERAEVEIAFREAVARADAEGAPRPQDNRGEPLRLVMSGTAGTGKTVAIWEMLRRVGQSRFLVLAPTGNAACALSGGQVRGQVHGRECFPSTFLLSRSILNALAMVVVWGALLSFVSS